MRSIKHIIFITVFALSSTALLAGGIKTSTANKWLDGSDFGQSCKRESAVKSPTKNHPFGSSYHYDIWGGGCLKDVDTINKTHVYYKDIPHLYINADGNISIRAH